MGRPSTYSETIAEAICDELMDGKSLRQVCESDAFPSRATVLRWQRENKDFDTRCAGARAMQADLMDDKILEVAQRVENGELEPKAGSVVLSAYQWRASKLAPKKYGDKVQQEVSGPDGGAIQSEHRIVFVEPKK